MLRRHLLSYASLAALAACATTPSTSTTPTVSLAQTIYNNGVAAVAAVQAALTAYLAGTGVNSTVVTQVQVDLQQAQGLLGQLQTAITTGISAVVALFAQGFSSAQLAGLLTAALNILLAVAPVAASPTAPPTVLHLQIEVAQAKVAALAK